MNMLDLYKQAGSPDRAVVQFAEPTTIYKSKKTSSAKQVLKFEAYLMVTHTEEVCYYFQRNSYRAFPLPDNVESITPVGTMELWRRARKAAGYIKAGKTHGRELDDAFENYDGDEMCAALWRMAQKDPALKNALIKEWGKLDSFLEQAQKFASLTNEELSARAEQSRADK